MQDTVFPVNWILPYLVFLCLHYDMPHLLAALSDMNNLPASSLCVKPFSLRSFATNAPNFFLSISNTSVQINFNLKSAFMQSNVSRIVCFCLNYK